MIDRIVVWVLRLKSERGQDLIEYAMLSGLIAIILVAASLLLGLTDPIQDMLDGIGRCIDFSSGTTCAPF